MLNSFKKTHKKIMSKLSKVISKNYSDDLIDNIIKKVLNKKSKLYLSNNTLIVNELSIGVNEDNITINKIKIIPSLIKMNEFNLLVSILKSKISINGVDFYHDDSEAVDLKPISSINNVSRTIHNHGYDRVRPLNKRGVTKKRFKY